MKVLVVTTAVAATGGIEAYSRSTASALRALGHDVELWAVFESGPDADVPLQAGTRYLAPKNPVLDLAHYRGHAARLAQLLATRRRREDLVLAMHPMLAPAVRWGAALGRHRSYAVWTYGTEVWGPWSAARERALRGSAVVGAVSRFTAQRVQERLPSVAVEVVHPCLSDDWFASLDAMSAADRPRRDRPVLLTVSRVSEADSYKGHDVVLKALPLLGRLLGQAVEYRVVGGGAGLERVARLAAQSGLGADVRLLGALSDHEMRREYTGCDAFVMPSRMDADGHGSYTGEGFGIVYLEAQAAGRPVVASNEGGAPEAIREAVTGLTVDPRSAAAVADACARLLTQPCLAAEMGRAGRAWVEKTHSERAFRERMGRVVGMLGG